MVPSKYNLNRKEVNVETTKVVMSGTKTWEVEAVIPLKEGLNVTLSFEHKDRYSFLDSLQEEAKRCLINLAEDVDETQITFRAKRRKTVAEEIENDE